MPAILKSLKNLALETMETVMSAYTPMGQKYCESLASHPTQIPHSWVHCNEDSNFVFPVI